MTNNPHLAPRTIREWLDLIPFDRARKEAIENCEVNNFYPFQSDDIVHSLSEAYYFSFLGSMPKDVDAIYEFYPDLHRTILRMEQSIKLKQQDHGASFGMGY